jgi:hypothetical protein
MAVVGANFVVYGEIMIVEIFDKVYCVYRALIA